MVGSRSKTFRNFVTLILVYLLIRTYQVLIASSPSMTLVKDSKSHDTRHVGHLSSHLTHKIDKLKDQHTDSKGQQENEPVRLKKRLRNFGKERRKLVLFWTKFFGKKPIYPTGHSIFSLCPSKEMLHPCELTYDKSLLNVSDVIMFHGIDLHWDNSDVPPYRLPHHVWVLYTGESPQYAPVHPKFNGQFNVTFSYRRDGEVEFSYGTFVPRDKELPANYFPIRPRNQSKLVAWANSHCKTASHREDYVEELRKHIPVDIYGHCAKVNCGDKKTVQGHKYCANILKQYTFYLAFENSLCADYVTEKSFRHMDNGLVPVVLGHSEYDKFLPLNSYIDIRDFKSPRDLAQYLYKVAANDTLYSQYTDWRRKYTVSMRSFKFCHLCHVLFANENLDKSYDDIDSWWNTACVTPETFYSGHFDYVLKKDKESE